MIKGYKRKNTSPRAMLKVDLRKAFDSVRWDFILSLLKAIDVPAPFINWISQCISTTSFSVVVNGSPCGFFRGTKGLRQGDPLSPYLFVLAMEVFSNILESRYKNGYIGYHSKAEVVQISHLIFADDVMIFFDGDSSSLHEIQETLEDFESWSGLGMNKDKTEIFCAGLSNSQLRIISSYGFKQGTLPIRYLGLPLLHKRLRISDFDPLYSSVTGAIKSWANKALSYAGRLQLISTVIYGILVFWMSTFRLPLGCIKNIEGICSRFLWAGNLENKKICKVSWKKVCYPKTEGGLGLRRLEIWNKSLVLRHVWSLFSGKDSLWVSWHKHHSIKNKSFWALTRKSSYSWNWNALLNLRPLAEKFITGILNDGHRLSFWFDTWTPFGPLLKFIGETGPSMFQIPISAKVFMAARHNQWIFPHPRTESSLAFHAHLTTINTPQENEGPDVYLWKVNEKSFNSYDSKLTWEACRPVHRIKSWASAIWYKGAVPKHAFHMWVAHKNRLPTKDRLCAWGLQIEPVCFLCQTTNESRDHLLLQCVYSKVIWSSILQRIDRQQPLFLTWSELLSWLKKSTEAAPENLRKMVTQATIYTLWWQRNEVLHNKTITDPHQIFTKIYMEVKAIISSRRYKKNYNTMMSKWIR